MLRPLQDRILLKKIPTETVTAGGIFIPETAKGQDPAFQAEVIAVGPGKTLEDGTVRPVEVAVGETVLVGRYHGNEVKLDGEDHLVIREEDILGVVEG